MRCACLHSFYLFHKKKTDTTSISSQSVRKRQLKQTLTFNYSSLAAININLNIERSLISNHIIMGCIHTHTSWSNIMQLSLPSQQLGDVFAYILLRDTPEPGRESHANTHNLPSAAFTAFTERRETSRRQCTMYDFTHTHTPSTLLAISRWVIYEQLHHFARGNIGFMSFGRIEQRF